MLQILPWLIAMAVLIGCSAFFSASEAALFSLRAADRRTLASGTPAQRAAAQLLSDADRVLSAIVFWNLVVNIAYFALASTFIEQHVPENNRWPLRIGALLLIIFFSEMLPKTLGVLIARQLATSLSLPLSLMVRLIDPMMPVWQLVMLISRRLVWPSFQPESELEAADLERAIRLSTDDAALLDQEQTVLRNIVTLSDLRADELMRPRTQLQTFRPPVNLSDLEGHMTQSGYLFIAEDDSENIRAAVCLNSLWSLHPDHLEAAAEPVVYVPWCASVADTLALLRSNDRGGCLAFDSAARQRPGAREQDSGEGLPPARVRFGHSNQGLPGHFGSPGCQGQQRLIAAESSRAEELFEIAFAEIDRIPSSCNSSEREAG